MVELVIVIVILGIIAAIAVPRIANAAAGASEAALQATLANVRSAMERYYAEHSLYPGANPGSGVPDGDAFVRQLTEYSDESGNSQSTYGTPYLYGPYLRSPFPENPFNSLKTVHVKATAASADPVPGSTGWVAVLSAGHFGINASDSELESIGIDTTEPRFRKLK